MLLARTQAYILAVLSHPVSSTFYIRTADVLTTKAQMTLPKLWLTVRHRQELDTLLVKPGEYRAVLDALPNSSKISQRGVY